MVKFTSSACEMIKIAANNAEREIYYWIERLMEEHDRGWDPNTLPMRDLKIAADILRSLAYMIEDQRLKLTAKETVDE